jgi:hypothetical protein
MIENKDLALEDKRTSLIPFSQREKAELKERDN